MKKNSFLRKNGGEKKGEVLIIRGSKRKEKESRWLEREVSLKCILWNIVFLCLKKEVKELVEKEIVKEVVGEVMIRGLLF